MRYFNKGKSLLLLFVALANSWPAVGATYFVTAGTGHDSADGSSGTPWLTLAKAASVAVAGDTIKLSGTFGSEELLSGAAGTSANRIVWDGQGTASVMRVSLNDPYYSIVNMTVEGYTVTPRNIVYLQRGAHGTIISNCVVDCDSRSDLSGIGWEDTAIRPFGGDAAANCLIISNRVTGVLGATAIVIAGNSNIIQGNYVHDLGQSDFVRLFGSTNQIIGNTFTNIFSVEGEGNHIDFIQTFGVGSTEGNEIGSWGHIIERNKVFTISGGALAQMEGNLSQYIGNWIFRNNIFTNIDNTASMSIPEIQFYNNVFYRCNVSSSPLTFTSRYYEVTNSLGYLVAGQEYLAISTNGLGSLTHNGTTITNIGSSGKGFLAVSNGFETTGDTVAWWGRRNYAHGGRAVNNAFIECGDGRTNRGWYGFQYQTPYGQTGLTNVMADYNFVVRTNFLQLQTNALGQSIGDAGGWDEFKWWEKNGINGGNPNVATFGTDWRPTTNSFLLGAGTNLTTWVTDDFIGDARTVPFTIGAYENAADGSEPPPESPPTINARPVTGKKVGKKSR